MELIKCEGEAEFHSVSDMNHKQEGEGLDLDEQVNSNPNSNSLIESKVTQRYDGAPIPPSIYTNKTVRAICQKHFFHNVFMLVF